MTLPPAEFALELQWLKEKVEAGASLIFTQMFYDVEIFIDWVKAVRKAGIAAPIIPGINPIQTWNGFLKSTKLAETPIPQSYLDILEPHKANDEKVRELGTQLVVKLCRDILDSGLGIRGLHFYTMNLERSTRMLLEQLQFVPRVEAVKPLPWRQSLTPSRRTETIRPIFWANRTKSYLSRTENWDEYPNGRFGDSRSPAYGEIPYDIKLPVRMPISSLEIVPTTLLQRDTAHQVWGHPETLEEIGQLFANFCRGRVASLPWSEDAPAPETGVISEHLARLNELGFLTINSQPAVNGAASNDPVHGWGPSNGYVYQKVCRVVHLRRSQKRPDVFLLGIPGIFRITRQPHLFIGTNRT